MKRFIISLAALFVTMAWVEAANAAVCVAGAYRAGCVGGEGRGRRSPPGGTLSLGQWGAGLSLSATPAGRKNHTSSRHHGRPRQSEYREPGPSGGTHEQACFTAL